MSSHANINKMVWGGNNFMIRRWRILNDVSMKKMVWGGACLMIGRYRLWNHVNVNKMVCTVPQLSQAGICFPVWVRGWNV